MKAFPKSILILTVSILFFTSKMAVGQDNIGLVADSLHAPYLYGVASGDPDTTSVLIWTAVELPTPLPNNYELHWEVALDEGFVILVSEGDAMVSASTDWTLNQLVTDLESYTTYYFRFTDNQGNQSVVGRTRTAPSWNDTAHLRFGVASCVSLYSGYFNAYERISERKDLDAVIMLGDYLYDFVDSDEEVRVPNPYPEVPENLQEWRDRHKSYLADPHLRLARQYHPWICIHDNHEVAGDYGDPDARQAFYEFVPMRLQDPTDPFKIYRELKYGSLLDIFMVDINTYRNQDPVPGSSELGLLGDDQYNWLNNKLQNSTAKWVFIGQQKLVGGWSLEGLPDWFPGDGTVFDTGSWDGNDAARDRILNDIEAMGRDNVIFLSGDLHMSFANDLSTNPYDGSVYDGSNGDGSIAVEFMPTSVTRGNFDESGVDGILIDGAGALSGALNVHHVWSDYEFHGFGLIDVQEAASTAEFWFTPKLNISNEQEHAKGVKINDGENHWERNLLDNPTPSKDLPLFAFPPTDCSSTDNSVFATSCINVCPGDSVYFFNNSEVAQSEYLLDNAWDYGDGSNYQNPESPFFYVYETDGSYTVTLQENVYQYVLAGLNINNANCDDIFFDNPDIYAEIIDLTTGETVYSSNPSDSDLPINISPNFPLKNNVQYLLRIRDEELLEAPEECGEILFTISDNGLIGNGDIEVLLNISTELITTNTYTQNIVVGGPDCTSSNSNFQLENINVSISPNPNNGTFILKWDNEINFDNIFIYNSNGKLIRSLPEYQNGTDINLVGLPAGYYMVKLFNSDGFTQSSFIISR